MQGEPHLRVSIECAGGCGGAAEVSGHGQWRPRGQRHHLLARYRHVSRRDNSWFKGDFERLSEWRECSSVTSRRAPTVCKGLVGDSVSIIIVTHCCAMATTRIQSQQVSRSIRYQKAGPAFVHKSVTHQQQSFPSSPVVHQASLSFCCALTNESYLCTSEALPSIPANASLIVLIVQAEGSRS